MVPIIFCQSVYKAVCIVHAILFESLERLHIYFAHIIFATIIQQIISLGVSPVGCTDDFYADINALQFFLLLNSLVEFI